MSVDAASAALEPMLRRGLDQVYFSDHRLRFRHAVARVTKLIPPGARILDIGSHFLHQAAWLRLLGYEVWAVDVPAFAEIDFVQQRGTELGIHQHTVQHMEDGKFLPEQNASFDLVLFCEILEHITFNPIEFWRRVHDLLRVGGKIYITTPNSLRLINLVHTIKQALLLRGIGPDVRHVFSDVTYGHHWKEYSAGEVKQYFELLSPDFEVDVGFYHYRAYPRSLRPGNLARAGARSLGRWIPRFDEELEVVVTLKARTGFRAPGPSYS